MLKKCCSIREREIFVAKVNLVCLSDHFGIQMHLDHVVVEHIKHSFLVLLSNVAMADSDWQKKRLMY